VVAKCRNSTVVIKLYWLVKIWKLSTFPCWISKWPIHPADHNTANWFHKNTTSHHPNFYLDCSMIPSLKTKSKNNASNYIAHSLHKLSREFGTRNAVCEEIIKLHIFIESRQEYFLKGVHFLAKMLQFVLLFHSSS